MYPQASTEEEAMICWYEERTAAMEAAERRYRAALARVQELMEERDKEAQG